MDNVDRRIDQYQIVASSSLTDEHIEVLKQGDTFGLFDQYGDIHSLRTGSHGLYHEGTRFLSRFVLTLNGERPLLLSSTVKQDNVLLNVDLTNPDMTHVGQGEVARGTLYLSRARFLWQGHCFERLRVHNYSLHPVPVRLSVSVDADFADLFEVRGMTRERRGVLQEATLERSRLRFDYTGLDNVVRRTQIECSPPPDSLSGYGLMFCYRLEPKAEREFHLTYSCQISDAPVVQVDYSRARAAAQTALTDQETPECCISTSNHFGYFGFLHFCSFCLSVRLHTCSLWFR